jgi:cell division protein FtsN
MIRLSVFCAVFLTTLAFATAAIAQQFKWVDRDGRVQYGDTPPPGVKATRLKPPPAPVSSPAQPSAKKDAKKLTPEQAFQKRQQEQREGADKSAQEQAEAQSKRANCEAAQSQLRQLQSGDRISTTTASGERAFLDDAQRARETERAQRAISEWCK